MSDEKQLQARLQVGCFCVFNDITKTYSSFHKKHCTIVNIHFNENDYPYQVRFVEDSSLLSAEAGELTVLSGPPAYEERKPTVKAAFKKGQKLVFTNRDNLSKESLPCIYVEFDPYKGDYCHRVQFGDFTCTLAMGSELSISKEEEITNLGEWDLL